MKSIHRIKNALLSFREKNRDPLAAVFYSQQLICVLVVLFVLRILFY